ncbi:MAG: regulatory signaling modulator protein AmpE [Pseudomonadota bacterium]|nr:regulatory signaling modulator protein AmpE [Pseudomonadota bacterium]
MNLLVILIATAVEKLLAEPLAKFRELRRLGWYRAFAGMAEQKLGGIEVFKGPVGVAILIALPVLVFYVVFSFINGILAFLGFLLSIVILLYCLGLQDLDAEIKAIVNAIRGGNEDEANRLAQAFSRSASPVDTQSRGRTVVESVFTEANGRVFGVIFWFALLGWFGAVLFRFSNELSHYATQASSGLSEWAGRVRNALSWIPARIAALGYAVAGNLTGAFNHWRVTETLDLQHTDTVLKQSGTGALEGAISGDEVERITAAQALVFRTLMVLLAILVIIHVISWIP